MPFVIAIIIAIWLIYLIFVHIIIPLAAVIIPILGMLLVLAAIAGVGYGLVSSIISFWKSFMQHLNPYKTYVDKNASLISGVKRSYFFGPGYHQITNTVKDAFAGQKGYLETLTDFRNKHATPSPSYAGFFEKCWISFRNLAVWCCYLTAVVCVFGFGFLWISVFSILMASTIFVGMCLFFMFFGALWLTDRGLLFIKSIQSRCGNCKRTSTIPNFACNKCGNEHNNLTPGPYGVLQRKCVCDEKMPTTFFNGRSKLKASCPFCTTELAVSDARQIGIQIIGGVSAGKTSFMAAFWHEYIERLNDIRGISFEKFPPEAFDELELWYEQGISSSTTETNANMYSIVHKDIKGSSHQFTLYDIAGEAFANLSNDIQQQQFKYCEGLVFIIDPTAEAGSVNETFSNFIKSFKALKGIHTTKISSIPVSVIISKADLYKREIGLVKIKARYKNNPDEFANEGAEGSLELTRNVTCREFLNDHEFSAVNNLIGSEFSNVQYFPVSAMGRPVAGEPYEPWGVMEPVMWILNQTAGSFKGIIAKIA